MRTCRFIRGDGGYVIMAPSVHPDTGRIYTFEVDHAPDNFAIADPGRHWAFLRGAGPHRRGGGLSGAPVGFPAQPALRAIAPHDQARRLTAARSLPYRRALFGWWVGAYLWRRSVKRLVARPFA